jgi:hypothetical protein
VEKDGANRYQLIKGEKKLVTDKRERREKWGREAASLRPKEL